MKKYTAPPLKNLEEEPLWKEACDLAEYFYGKLHLFPEAERYTTVSKLRNSANDLMFSVGQALGNSNPGGVEFDWGNARKSASALKTMYRFATRQEFIELEPEIMVRLDKLIKQIGKEVEHSYARTQEFYQHELDLWREKYALWRKAQP